MQIRQVNSPNRVKGRNGHVPDFIVCHQTGAGFQSAINTITNPRAQVSYHFVVSNTGEVVQAVDIKNTAWANGTRLDGGNMDSRHSKFAEIRDRRRNANLYTVSIGFADTVTGILTPLQFSAAVELIRHIADEVLREYGKNIPYTRDRIIGHSDIVPRHRPGCPGRDFPFSNLLECLNEG